MTATDPVLQARSLSVRYGRGAVGVAGLDLEVGEGQIVALVGPNGGGKTSTLRGLAGFLRREEVLVGADLMTMSGLPLLKMPLRDRVKAGLVYVPERDKVFLDLTIREQLELSWAARRKGGVRAAMDAALDLFPELRDHLSRRGGYLSGGQRQMVALASAVCMHPAVLMIDEVTLGLAPTLVERMATTLKRLAERGIGLLIAEQSLALAMEVADHVHVLDAGREVAAGKTSDLGTKQDFVDIYLGVGAR